MAEAQESADKSGQLPFGQREPPLTDQIVNILGRYPDGGQILKELIQNADDAGAKEVKFLYDGRHFGVKYLATGHLRNFQGPALYAFNDAKFKDSDKDSDWEGIQNLMRSNKKSDILKAGRFGIGFNSVYHITDLPGIASGNKIGFLDPHKECFEKGKSGAQYVVNSNLLETELRDQFEPFEGVFGFDFHKNYPHTLFRFPLRKCPSKLSQTSYTKEKVNKLFESLYEEAPIILLFMKNIQRIGVYERLDENDSVKCRFEVEIAQEMREIVQQERQTMLEKAVKQHLTESSYLVDISLSSMDGTDKKCFRWLVLNQIGLAEEDERIKELSETLRLLPWVGCAVPVNKNAQEEDSGRIFCFLPLPHDVDCKTGLSILVHGAFGVTDNRRGLLWPGGECQNTETAEWNVLLVGKILSFVVRNALKAIITDNPATGLGEVERRDLVYNTLPKLSGVVGHWKSFLVPLFRELEHLNLFLAESFGCSSWITLQDGLLDQMRKNGVSAEMRKTVLKTLLQSHSIITELPEHVSEIVEKYFGERQDITPEFLRNFLKTNSVQTASRDDKLRLLEYVLHDNPHPQMLTGIPLLPLSSGEFVAFTRHCHNSNSSQSIFVPSDSCTEDILPNMQSRFLNMNIPEESRKKLVDMAANSLDQSTPTQMVLLTPDLVVSCLRYSLPDEWFDPNHHFVSWKHDLPRHPPEKWITDIWHWINDTFEESLDQFERIPLIPFEMESETKLGVLSKGSKFIFSSDFSQNMQLPSQIVEILQVAGCVVLPCQPAFLHVRHPDIRFYIASPVPVEVMLLLQRALWQSAKEYIKDCPRSKRKEIQKFFAPSQMSREDVKQYVSALRDLPLLDTLSGAYTAAVVEGKSLWVASSEFKLPHGFNFRKADQIISSGEPESAQLISLLDLDPSTPADIFCDFLFPDIKSQSIYHPEEITTIMLWILERECELKERDARLVDEIKNLSFVSTRKGELRMPCQLYNPSDPLLEDLFIGDDSKFPSKEFSEPRVILTLLDLGLRTQDMITSSDLLGVAETVASTEYQNSLSKVKALVQIFQQHPEFSDDVFTKLANIAWLPRARKYKKGFPSFMKNEWYNGEIMFYKSHEIFRESHMLLVGTSAPILGVEMENDLQDSLGINKEVNVDQVIKHLKTAVQVWDERKKSAFEMLKEIYVYLSKMSSQEDVSETIQRNDLVNWVWHGAGFCPPKQLALKKEFVFELRPPLFLLPDSLNDGESLTSFFQTYGVREQFSKEDVISVLPAIKKVHEESVRPISSKNQEKDLTFCRSVLEWLVNDGQMLGEELRKKIFVPVQNDDSKLVLEECDKCTYCDQEWLKRGKSDLDIPNDIQQIHDSITTKTAILLGVPSLSSCLLSAECVEFEQTGPYEPITTRIRNILNEYKKGVGIFKELIQNADDAGANAVKFLVDWRTGKTDSLFSPGMAPSQGPALWAYNNAVFTDKDFENINKLAGGTKVEDLSKIGRFGLGFNAVYHLTDVPSFISRSFLCIFDPNVNHIPNHIRDKSRPGIRINLAKNPRPLTAFADQFSLYNEIFECKTALNNNEKFSYPGTLFRFPFRTEIEAEKSEMCNTAYDQRKVKDIVDTLQRNASLILLFTQNVKRVELYELSAEDRPQNMKLILSINKEIPTIPKDVQVSPYIEQCSSWWREKPSLNEAPSFLEQVAIQIEGEDRSTATEIEARGVKTFAWLVSYCVGKDLSIKLAREEGEKDGLLPLAGAAALLQSNSNDGVMTAERVNGEAFCFLPLSISTGLPVHVNSSFAVRSNRDGIWEKTTTETNLESRWNDSLFRDAIPEAYFKLLCGMMDLSENNSLTQFDRRFHDFWPRLGTSRSSWTALVSSFYTKLLERNLKLFCSNGKWMDIHGGFILDDELRKHDGDRVVKTLQCIGKHVFDLPSDVVNAMKDSADDSVKAVLEKQTLNFVSFFQRFLFPNLSSTPAALRNPIIHRGLHYLLDETRQGWQELMNLYKKSKCIPCSPDGEKLARPCDLIDPNDESISRLFSPEEGRFPFGNLDSTQLFVLEQLEMVKDLLSWKEIYGRAMSIEKLAETDKDAALQRSRYLVYYLRCNMERLKQITDISSSPSLQKIKFLPVRLVPTKSYTLPWKGAEVCSTQFFSPDELFLPEDDTLIGSACLIVDDTEESGCGSLEVLKGVLGFSRRPSNHQVFEQLEITRESDSTNEMKIKVCKRVYKHLNDGLDEDSDVTRKLQTSPWLYLEGTFVENRKIALNWNGYAVPFLYNVPGEYKREFKNLLQLAGIKKRFTANDFLEALDSLRESKQDIPLTLEDIQLVVTLITQLKTFSSNDAVKQRFGTIPLPDTSGMLYDSKDLTIPESFEVKYNNKGELFIHQDIAQDTALKLGAKALRARRREKYGNTMSMSFGQFEKLTDRIKNILESYPCDVGILKELVQNADDAKATEIQFIYDKRVLPHERVLQTNANDVQGPALCVYNNKHFSEDDFKGICKLGIGSKHDDPAKTGQYGIGFNAVYHLTDCPSFLSNDSTLCILDPHCEYAPEATLDAPGGRYDNIDDDFRDIFSHTVSSFLGEFSRFPLKDSTMFRLPLRTNQQAERSEISGLVVTDVVMERLLREFQTEAKKLLLFLNHVKEIGLWEIDENSMLKPIYSVSSQLKRKSEKKLHELHDHLQEHKNLKTHEIPIKDTTYSINIQDTLGLKEKWLIHQSFGIKEEKMNDEQTPNVCDLGLFPRGGIAALLSTTKRSDVCVEKYVAYCFLPLPVRTSLPVHVNGHFALDGSRRDLWSDPRKTCRKTNWNGFMKEQVLGPAYASLITKTRKHIPHCEKESEKIFFSNEDDATEALVWYHKSFPDPEKHPQWNALTLAVYNCLKEAKIFPVVSQSRGVIAAKHQYDKCGSRKSSGTRLCRHENSVPFGGHYRNASGKHVPRIPQHREGERRSNSKQVKMARYAFVSQRRCEIATRFSIEWLPPNLVYFTEEEQRERQKPLLMALLQIRMPVLLYTPMRIHKALKKSEVTTYLLSPENVIKFLLKQDESSRCDIGTLPIQPSHSNIQNDANLQTIFKFLKEKLNESPSTLEGLPLLLTADNELRVFTVESPVYCTEYCNLFPDKAYRFVHLQFVPLLLSFCEAEPDIIRHLTIQSLAEEFMPDVFHGMLLLGETKHVPWCYPENGVLSKEWFRILWKFFKDVKPPEENDNPIMRFLGKYPIIPTKDGNLATIDNAKSVLAMTSSRPLNSLQKPVAKILQDLSCPFLDESITKNGLSVVFQLVAHPDRESDVLHVLDYMNSTGILDLSKFDDEKIFTLLKFFQADFKNETSMKKAKTLPFYKGVDGEYHSLLSHGSYIKVPAGLPKDGTKELQSIYDKGILLFPSSLPSDLNELFEALGIKVNCYVSEFYINYVLPNFSSLSRECQIEFLTHIRTTRRHINNITALIEKMKSTSCVPDQTGNLRVASTYLNPHNELFQVMFATDADVFPAAPFNDKQWLEFLLQIGMKRKCDQEQFVEFANRVEQSALEMAEYDENIITQSKALVKYLLGNERDGNWSFYSIPGIKFIVPKAVKEELSSIHPQYRGNKNLEFVSYSDSVPWVVRNLIWTSYKLLPDWAYPCHNDQLISALGITAMPPLEAVFQHTETMSKCASEIILSGRTLPEKLEEVFKTIYKFLGNLMKRCAKEPSSDCNEKCRKIGEYLTPVACILLNEERCLVRGEKLSIEDAKDKLKPHFYKIPRDYAPFDHLLKRLGATEKISASQMTHVLKSIKDSCTDKKMNTEEEQKACFATSLLFKSLLDDKETEADSRLANCKELLLPSMAKRLINSNELVCEMQPRLRESIAKQGYEILIPFEKCGMRRELENDYLQALPKRLRPTPLSELVREELHPSCKKTMGCTSCLAMDHRSFIQKFILLLRSSQFERGIIRLLKHQKGLTELDEQDRERAARFTSAKLTTIKCMEQVQIHLVNVSKKEPIPQSSLHRSCHVEKEDNSWTLYIQHEFGGRKNHAIFAKAVNEIMDECLEQTAELSDMLSCDSPSQIPGVLNDHNVAIDYNEENEQFGLSVPDVYHYLIIQKPLCNYEEGARVAYDEDEGGAGHWKQGELTGTSIRYKFVKINSRANAVDEDAEEFDFKAQYKIDLGSKTDYKIVNVLDLYSYKQDEMGNLVPNEDDDEDEKVDVFAEKYKIRRALKLAKNNLKSLAERQKVVRRFLLHWLRYKIPETATEMTRFIENEVTKLEILCLEDTRAFSSYWRRYGTRERTTYRSYSRWTYSDSSSGSHGGYYGSGSHGGYYGSGSHGGHYDPWDYVSPDAKEAERWIKQSQADLNVAKWLLDKSFSQVCYMSQQCVEKALKGVLYAKCGIPRVELRTHYINRLVNVCRGLERAPSEALDRAGGVAGYYLPTRYPDNQPQYRVPAEEYSEEQAEKALEIAGTVFGALHEFAFD